MPDYQYSYAALLVQGCCTFGARMLHFYWHYLLQEGCELYIKELKNGLGADRMSCANFAANQFRLFMHAAAYVLLLETKHILFRGCELSHATISTFREYA